MEVRRPNVWRLEVVLSEIDRGAPSRALQSPPPRGLRPRSCIRVDVSIAGVLATLVHAERAREVMVATVSGMHACMELDDEGAMHASASVAAVRATNSHPEAQFAVVLASPVVTARTTQVRRCPRHVFPQLLVQSPYCSQFPVSLFFCPHSMACDDAASIPAPE